MTTSRLTGLLLALPATLWLIATFAGPLGIVVLLAFQDASDPFAPLSLAPSLTQFQAMLADWFYVEVLARTSLLAIVVALISAIFGYPVALWLARMPVAWRPWGFALVLIPLLTNVVVRSLGIVLLLAPDGLINGLLAGLGLPRAGSLLYNYGAVGLALLQVFLPFMVLALYDILQSTPPRVVEAAESLGASPARRFINVEFPLSLPGLSAGLSLVFLMSSTAYVSATLLGGKKVWTTGMLVWQEALQNLNGPFASALALAMTAVALLTATLIAVGARRLTPWIGFRQPARLAAPEWFSKIADVCGPALARAALVLALLLLVLPLVLVFVQSFNDVPQATVAGFRHFTLRWYVRVLEGGAYMDAFLVSARLAGAAMAIALLLATLAAFAITRFDFPGRSIVTGFWMLPLTLPHVAVGVGMLRLLQIYTSLPPFLGLLCVHVALILPFAITLLRASVLQLDPALEDAAQSLGAGPVSRILFVILPGLTPGLCAAGIISFLLSFEEVTVTSFLTTARLTTLPVRIYAEAGFSLEPTVHAVSTMLVVMTTAALILVGRLMRIDRVFAR